VTAGTVEAAGVELAFEEHGSGPAVLLIHGTASTRTVWRETIAALGPEVRAITYDRRGYGESGAPEPYHGTTVEEQAQDAAELIRSLELPPVVVCGHSLGAMIALELLLRHRELVRGAVVIEPPLLPLAATGTEVMAEVRERVTEAAREGGPPAAVKAFIEGFGPQILDRLGPEREAAALSASTAFAADLAAVTAWEVSRRRLARIDGPVVVLTGSASAPAWGEVMRELVEAVPDASLREAAGGHFLHLDAPADVAEAVRELATG
jgi:pimeloyl-ACP methyl ester carboxylesterase